MIKKLGSSLRWFALLCAKFLQVSPFGTIISVILSFTSQLALIASMLLPLKIIMIMSSGQIPNILPESLTPFGEKSLIAGFSGIAVASFFFYNASNKITVALATRAATLAQLRNDKLILFENQESLSETAHLKVTSALASILFTCLAISVIYYIYPELALAIFYFLIACFLSYSVIYNYLPTKKEKIEEKLNLYLNILANIGFLSAFLFIVADYMYSTIPGFLSVLGSIVLSRQLFSQASIATQNIYFINNNKEKLGAVFFRSQIFQPTSQKSENSPWQFLEDPSWKRALLGLLSSSGLDSITYNLQWQETGFKNILFITATSSTNEQKTKYLIKIFDKRRAAEARHEATLLMSPPTDLPAPPLIKASKLSGYHIHIFDISGYAPVKDIKPTLLLQQTANSLFSVVPTEKMIDQYRRSKTMLWDRVNIEIIKKLKVVAKPDQRSSLELFEEKLPTLKQRLKTIPLRIVNKPTRAELCLRSPKGSLVQIHWGRWSIEPIGAEYPVSRSNHGAAEMQNQSPVTIQKQVTEACFHDFKLANNFGRIASFSFNGRYQSALTTVEDILQDSEIYDAPMKSK